MNPIIAITLGDAAGIGPEIILKALAQPEIYRFCRPLVIGHKEMLSQTQTVLGLNIVLKTATDASQIQPGEPAVWDFTDIPPPDVRPGNPDAATGGAAAAYIRKAVELALQKQVAAMVTAPISKYALHQAGYPYPGHTELLAELTQTKEYAMMLVGGPLRVILVTTHCALKDVPARLSRPKLLEIIRLTHKYLPGWGVKNPRIAVAALNPHAGESGILGGEERDILAPAIRQAQAQGIQVSGPWPADSLFYRAAQGEFNAVVCMYHDQGLIPLKLLAFRQAVNITLGLPILRTSVGHGCAFDIAGKGQADPQSLIQAIKLAAQAIGAANNEKQPF